MKYIGIFVVSILSAIFSGFTLFVLWGWFIVPLGVKAVSIPLALGISLTVRQMTIDLHATREKVDTTTAMLTHIAANASFLGIGWIYHCFL